MRIKLFLLLVLILLALISCQFDGPITAYNTKFKLELSKLHGVKLNMEDKVNSDRIMQGLFFKLTNEDIDFYLGIPSLNSFKGNELYPIRLSLIGDRIKYPLLTEYYIPINKDLINGLNYIDLLKYNNIYFDDNNFIKTRSIVLGAPSLYYSSALFNRELNVVISNVQDVIDNMPRIVKKLREWKEYHEKYMN